MKYLLVTILVFISLTATVFAGQKAISDTGEEVILNSDGTWEYVNNGKKAIDKIKTNKNKFTKSTDASFQLKSTKNNSTIWINTDKWSFKKPKEEGVTEYTFQLKGKDVYAMVITEGVEFDMEALTDIALTNARGVAPDIKIIAKEYRNVNDRKIIYMQMNGTIQGGKFTYVGYYHSNASGSTQFVAYTSQKFVEKYHSDIFEFLNGLYIR